VSGNPDLPFFLVWGTARMMLLFSLIFSGEKSAFIEIFPCVRAGKPGKGRGVCADGDKNQGEKFQKIFFCSMNER